MNAQDKVRSSNIKGTLKAAIQQARNGNKEKARRMLLDIVESDPSREDVWLWLAGVGKDLEESLIYLETVLALNPNHQNAQKGLALVKQRIAKAQEVEKQAPQEEQPQRAPETTSPHPAQEMISCPSCGHSKPKEAPFCPSCGHLEGKSAVEEVSNLQPIPATAQSAARPINVNDEVSPSFTLSIEQAEAIDTCLERMAYESEASSIILADITGQLISERGKTNNINTQVLSALAAGELSATQEMARLVGERARFNLLLHEGQERSVYLSPVGHKMLLIIVFDGQTPIGLVRIILKNAVEELGPILERPAHASNEDVNNPLNAEFARELEDELDASLDFMIE